MDERPSWVDRQMRKASQRLKDDPRAASRAERSWFGRLIAGTARRVAEGWEPDLLPDERIEAKGRAERVRLIFGITPGRVFVTNRRLVFDPAMRMPAFWSGSVELERNESIVVRSGRFFSRGIHFTFWFMPGRLPGWLHIANLEVKRGRKRFWFRVIDPDRWERLIATKGAD